jgi:hypothetical protein
MAKRSSEDRNLIMLETAMAVEIYWNDLAPDAYLKLETWKAVHEDDGFVLNRKARDVAVLHRAWCRHLNTPSRGI